MVEATSALGCCLQVGQRSGWMGRTAATACALAVGLLVCRCYGTHQLNKPRLCGISVMRYAVCLHLRLQLLVSQTSQVMSLISA